MYYRNPKQSKVLKVSFPRIAYNKIMQVGFELLTLKYKLLALMTTTVNIALILNNFLKRE